MSKSNTSENSFLALIYNATAWANVADNAASSPITTITVRLHTSDPGEAGTGTTNEANYTSYAPVAVNRNSGGWTVATNTVVNAGAVTFPACTGGSNSITHFSTTTASGASTILHYGPVGAITGVFGYTVTAADTVTTPGYSPTNDDRVSIYTVEGSASVLGAGGTQGTVYFVISASGETCQLSLTSGGAAINFTTSGAGMLHKHSVLAVSSGITPSFTAGQLLITEG